MIPTAISRIKAEGDYIRFGRPINVMSNERLTFYKRGFVIRWTPLKTLYRRLRLGRLSATHILRVRGAIK